MIAPDDFNPYAAPEAKTDLTDDPALYTIHHLHGALHLGMVGGAILVLAAYVLSVTL